MFEKTDPGIKRLKGLRAIFEILIQRGQLDLARQQYDASHRDSQPELWPFSLPASPLVGAYAVEGKVGEALQLFREELKNLAERCEDEELQEELQEACLALSESNDVWTLYEEAEKLVEKHGDEDSRRWLLEGKAFLGYTAISRDHIRRLYEGAKVRERHENEGAERQRSQALVSAYGDLFKPGEALQLFRKAYRKLAEIYQDKELQEACLALSESNDVWTLNEEAKKLADQYKDEQLRLLLLAVIAAFSGESVIYYSKTGNTEKAQALYNDLKQMVQEHGERQPELALREAKGAVNLVYAYVTAGKPDEARAVYKELRKLAEGHPERPQLRVWQANRASDVIYAYATAKKPDEAQTVYEELRKLAEDRPDEPKLRVWQAEGAVDLMYAYCKAGKYVEAKKIFQELEELRNNDNVEREIGKKKINGLPVMDWLRQLLQKDSDS